MVTFNNCDKNQQRAFTGKWVKNMFLLLSGKQHTQGGQNPHLKTAPGTQSREKWDSVPEHLKLPKT